MVDELTPRAMNEHFGSRYVGPLPPLLGGTAFVMDNSHVEGLPRPLFVHLYEEPEDASNPSLNAVVRAKITYTNGAATNVLRCDWGQQFALNASAIVIEIETYKRYELEAYDANPDVARVFGATIGLGGAPREVALTTSSEEMQGNVGAQILHRIPPFAVRFFPVVTEATGALFTTGQLLGCTITVFDVTGRTRFITQLTQDMLLFGFPVTADMHEVRFQSTAPIFLTFALVFKLAL